MGPLVSGTIVVIAADLPEVLFFLLGATPHNMTFLDPAR